MNRIKKIAIFFLCVAMFFAGLPIQCQAAPPKMEQGYVSLCQFDSDGNGNVSRFLVYKCNSDLLFSCRDLEQITGYSYRDNNGKIVFARGTKEVIIDPKSNKVSIGGQKISAHLPSQVFSDEGVTYISGAGVFPWLNVSCAIEDEILYIQPDIMSFWDIKDEFESEVNHLLFDFYDCCNQLNKNGKWLKILSYIENNGIKGILKDLYYMPFQSYSYGSYKKYYDVLYEMVETKDSAIAFLEDPERTSKKLKAIFSFAKAVKVEDDKFPEEIRFIKAGNKLDPAIKEIRDFYNYLYSYGLDNDEKLMWLRYMTLNRTNYSYEEALVAAAIDVENVYSSIRDGIDTRIAQWAIDWSTGKLISEMDLPNELNVFLKGSGVIREFMPTWERKLDKISLYNTIASDGLGVYRENKDHINDTYSIELLRAHASLFLYASARSWSIMSDYAANKGYPDRAEEYKEKENKALTLLEKFELCRFATENDSYVYGKGRFKEEYSDLLEKSFSGLSVTVSELDIRYQEGIGLIYDGKLEEALKLFNELKDSNPMDARIYKAISAIYCLEDEVVAALSELEEGIRIIGDRKLFESSELYIRENSVLKSVEIAYGDYDDPDWLHGENRYYDEFGYLQRIEYSDETVRRYEYDENHNITRIEDTPTDSYYEVFAYNARNEVIYHKEESYPAWREETNEYTYDGDLLTQMKCLKSWTYGYEAVIYDSTETVKYEYDNDGNVIIESVDWISTDNFLNADGSITQEKEAGEYEIAYRYDGAGNLIYEKNQYGQETFYEYDESGNMIHEKQGKIDTYYEYDEVGRQIEITSFGGTQSDGIPQVFKYDDRGNLIEERSFYGTTISAYDLMNQVVEEHFMHSAYEEEITTYINYYRFNGSAKEMLK